MFHRSMILTIREVQRLGRGDCGVFWAVVELFGHSAPIPRCFFGAGDSTVSGQAELRRPIMVVKSS